MSEITGIKLTTINVIGCETTQDFMKQVPDQLKEKVRSYIMKSSFKYQTESVEESFKLNFRAHYQIK